MYKRQPAPDGPDLLAVRKLGGGGLHDFDEVSPEDLLAHRKVGISQAVAFSWSDYYLLIESRVLALIQVISPMYPFQMERIPLTSTIDITETIDLIATYTKVSLIKYH